MSTLVIACPICLQKIRAPENVLGRQIKCPQCKNGFTAVDPNAIPTGPIAPADQPAREQIDHVDPTRTPDALGLNGDEVFPAAAPAESGGNSFVDFLMFRRMVTPAILTGLFYFGVAVILLIGLVYAIISLIGITGKNVPLLVGLLSLLLDFVITVTSVVLWRVLCEAVITLFRILEQLREVNDQIKMR